jgi:addiction module HigA family antidote
MSKPPNLAPHPGKHIKESVIPAGMTVKKASELVGVGRPALSNLLNGNASLSPDMAIRLEKAFGAKRETLLQMQAAYDESQTWRREKEIAVRAYAPSFMDITASQIVAWADKTEARALLPAFLRKLVLTTGSNPSRVDFPAHDNAQRHGWDGQIETDTATPWVPAGASGWEFGCNKDPRQKADDDYAARTASVPGSDQKNTTFVFVTPRNWNGKDAWAKQRRAEQHWKDVRALDASDLEQWLEQSVPTQNWMANRLGIDSDDMLSLEDCWDRWAKVAQPELSKSLFRGAIETHKDNLARWLKNPPSRPFVVTADSEEETLAFIACLLDALSATPGEVSDKAVVLRSVAAFRKATRSSSTFIPIIASPEVEAAIAGLHKNQHTIIVRMRGAIESEPDIALDLVDDDSFRSALFEMGIAEENIPGLARASGQSRTILRRHLSDVPEIRVPPWAKDGELTQKLIPLGFAGAWDGQSKEDQEILRFLTTADTYEAVEKSVAELLRCEHPPVWAVGRYRGVVSKIDVLYAIHHLVTRQELDNFFLTAQIVLSEHDPALDLPEEKRYAASIYGKTRNHSAALRDAIRETLVLLAIHGNNLFRERLGLDIEGQVNRVIRELLTPVKSETWASHRIDLPSYAEAAPEIFLDIVEQDLQSDQPKILFLLKPSGSDLFGGGCPRSGLLWALEILAWQPHWLLRVASLLARLSETRVDDNWTNKPENSLKAIFRAWMPQTAANVEDRCAVIKKLTRSYPKAGWRICVDQFDPHSTVGHYSCRPRWRKDASGAGQPVTSAEAYAFARKAFDLAVDWANHDEHTLGDLVQRIDPLDDQDQKRIWDCVRAWIATKPSDTQKAFLRERIRTVALTSRARRRGVQKKSILHAKEIYDLLIASDPVVRHQWMFAQNWVEEPFDENEEESFDYHKHEEKIVQLRRGAIAEVWNEDGYEGVLRLCESGAASSTIGMHLAESTPLRGFDQADFINLLASEPPSRSPSQVDMCISGFLFRMDDGPRDKLLSELITRSQKDGPGGESKIIRLLKCAPFKGQTWQHVDRLSSELQSAYWKEALPNYLITDRSELRELVGRLLRVNRPHAALASARFRVEELDSRTIVRLLKEAATKASGFDEEVRFNSYEISKIFEVLDGRTDVSSSELAHLEFTYLTALEHDKRGIPNLERQLAGSPTLFMQFVALAFKRNDDGEDPAEWRIPNEDTRKDIGTQSYWLLKKAKRIPGTRDDGAVDLVQLKAWIKEVRALCKAYAREEVGDSLIGELLSKSPPGTDGIWPSEVVRDALEELGTPKIADGMAVGLYNQRGAHWRDVGGRQERDLAAKYRGWSRQTAIEWLFTSRLLERIAKTYDWEAEQHDTDATLRKRLPD